MENYQICQNNKWETLQPTGLMHLLSIPTKIWSDISMDFIESLLNVSGKIVIFVVVYRFLELCPLHHFKSPVYRINCHAAMLCTDMEFQNNYL